MTEPIGVKRRSPTLVSVVGDEGQTCGKVSPPKGQKKDAFEGISKGDHEVK